MSSFIHLNNRKNNEETLYSASVIKSALLKSQTKNQAKAESLTKNIVEPVSLNEALELFSNKLKAVKSLGIAINEAKQIAINEAKFNFSEKEVKDAAEALAKAMAKLDNVNVGVHDFEYDEGEGAGFELSWGGEDYDGGSYYIKANGDVINAAVGGGTKYGNIKDTEKTFLKALKKAEPSMRESNSEFLNWETNEGGMSDIYQLADESKDEDSFIKSFFKDFGDKVKKSAESIVWAKTIYKDSIELTLESAIRIDEGYMTPKVAKKLKIGSVIKTIKGSYTITDYGQRANAFKQFEADMDGDQYQIQVSMFGSSDILVAKGKSLNFGNGEMLESYILEGLTMFDKDLASMIKNIKNGYGWIAPMAVHHTWANSSDSISWELVKMEIFRKLIDAKLLAEPDEDNEEAAGDFVKSLKDLGKYTFESVVNEMNGYQSKALIKAVMVEAKPSQKLSLQDKSRNINFLFTKMSDDAGWFCNTGPKEHKNKKVDAETAATLFSKEGSAMGIELDGTPLKKFSYKFKGNDENARVEGLTLESVVNEAKDLKVGDTGVDYNDNVVEVIEIGKFDKVAKSFKKEMKADAEDYGFEKGAGEFYLTKNIEATEEGKVGDLAIYPVKYDISNYWGLTAESKVTEAVKSNIMKKWSSTDIMMDDLRQFISDAKDAGGEDLILDIHDALKLMTNYALGMTKESVTEHDSANPHDKYEVRLCDVEGTPWAVWEGDVRVQCFETEEEAIAFAAEQNKEQGLTEDVNEARSINKIQKDWNETTSNMQQKVLEWKEAEGDRKSELLEELKALTDKKKQLESELEASVSGKDKDLALAIGEGNAFGAARAKAIANDDTEFEVDGEEFEVEDVDKEDEENAEEFVEEKETVKITLDSLVEAFEVATNESLRSDVKKFIKDNSKMLNDLADEDQWELMYQKMYDEFGIEADSKEAKDYLKAFQFSF